MYETVNYFRSIIPILLRTKVPGWSRLSASAAARRKQARSPPRQPYNHSRQPPLLQLAVHPSILVVHPTIRKRKIGTTPLPNVWTTIQYKARVVNPHCLAAILVTRTASYFRPFPLLSAVSCSDPRSQTTSPHQKCLGRLHL